jgi:amino acid transporter
MKKAIDIYFIIILIIAYSVFIIGTVLSWFTNLDIFVKLFATINLPWVIYIGYATIYMMIDQIKNDEKI